MLPLPHSARRSARWSRSQHKRARTPATRPHEPRPRETKLWLCGRTVMPDASRQPHKRCYLQSRPHAVSQREPSASGPRRLPARQRDRRPGSLKITSSCASPGCGTVTRTAFRRPRRHATARDVAVRAPACRHPARQPTAAAVGGNKAWPAHPGCSPPSIPKGSALRIDLSAGHAISGMANAY
jgi:hypothetical protein